MPPFIFFTEVAMLVNELLGVMLASPNQYAKKFFDDVQII